MLHLPVIYEQDQEKVFCSGQGAPPKTRGAIHRIMVSEPHPDSFTHLTQEVTKQRSQQNYIICNKQRCNSEIPELETLISCLNITNRIGDKGQPWLVRSLTLC